MEHVSYIGSPSSRWEGDVGPFMEIIPMLQNGCRARIRIDVNQSFTVSLTGRLNHIPLGFFSLQEIGAYEPQSISTHLRSSIPTMYENNKYTRECIYLQPPGARRAFHDSRGSSIRMLRFHAFALVNVACKLNILSAGGCFHVLLEPSGVGVW